VDTSTPTPGARQAGPLRARWQAWWAARHPRTDTVHLSQRNIYILPSRPGLAFCATLLVLLLASINDQLSLGYLLTFLLGGAGLASMHSTHGNLQGLDLDLKEPAPVFAGEELHLQLRLHNSGAARFGIGLQLRLPRAPRKARSANTVPAGPAQIAWTDVPALGHAGVQLRCPTGRRGRHGLPELHIITRFPLGLFRAWSVWRPAAQAWVYPRPEVPAPPFAPQPAARDGSSTNSLSRLPGQEFDGVRAYRQGDSLRQVLWKKAALSLQAEVQGSGLWVRDSQAPSLRELWLDWRDTAAMPANETDLTERRLSRLAAWVLEAERQQLAYGLRLGRLELPPGLGAAHQQQCLQALAAYGSDPEAATGARP